MCPFPIKYEHTMERKVTNLRCTYATPLKYNDDKQNRKNKKKKWKKKKKEKVARKKTWENIPQYFRVYVFSALDFDADVVYI